MHTTSTSLLMRLRQPTDKAAWSRFVRLYGPLIYRWGQRAGLNADDAADLVQDVMAQLVRVLPTFQYDQSRSFRSWLKTVTRNKWREKCRRKSLPMTDATVSGLARLPDRYDELEFWESEYRTELIARALEFVKRDFQPKTWEASRRYAFGEASVDELAKEYGLSVWTIYSGKSRLLKKLRDELDGLLD